MTITRLFRILAAPLVAVTFVTLTACVPSSSTPAPQPGGGESGEVVRWPVKTQPHVDAWLHGFAMITNDTTPVPLFRRGYRDSLIVLKNRVNAFTALDANRAELSSRLNSTPALQNAQFLAFSFASWDDLAQAINLFLTADGNPQRASDERGAAVISFLGAQFPTAADRTWLRRFFDGLVDERNNFYQAFWTAAQRDRVAALTAVTNLWEQQYQNRFQRFLNATQQRNGELIPSLPLGPEGRASGGGGGPSRIAVPLPARAEDAREAILVFAHEMVGSTAGSAVADNTTPAEKRMGESSRYVAYGQVRGGLMVLQSLAPELVAPYVRYYLAQGGHRVPSGATDAQYVSALTTAYPLPTAIVTGMRRQIDIALGGI